MVRLHAAFALTTIPLMQVWGLTLDLQSDSSIKSAASSLASSVLEFYHGNESGNAIGLLPSPPYFWWESGAMFDTLIQYWRVTGDVQYNDLISQGLVAQQGPNSNFMPPNQTASLGNDDQAQWALAALSAAEAAFPQPANTSWILLAEAVFASQAARWDNLTCSGGLRWQLLTFNAGYDYKNANSNGYFFQLAARLASSVSSGSSNTDVDYVAWATRVFEWTTSIGLIDENYNVYDGAQTEEDCANINRLQFSPAAGTYIAGAAHMYNLTTGDTQKYWKTALDGLLNRTLSVFFPSGVATEIACEVQSTCNTDMLAYKGLLLHWLADSAIVAPYTAVSINNVLATSAQAAVKGCDSTGCPSSWGGDAKGNDTDGGVGQQLSVLSAVQALLVHEQKLDASTTPTTPASSSGTTSASASASTSTVADSKGSASSKHLSDVLWSGSIVVALAILL